jgi:hypothetical protein
MRKRHPRVARYRAEGKTLTSNGLPEERVVYSESFHSLEFDFLSKSVFTRYDCCEFVQCTLLIDQSTEQLAFTRCVFRDCNIDRLQWGEARGIYAKDNFFDRSLEKQRAEFDARLADALGHRKVIDETS